MQRETLLAGYIIVFAFIHSLTADKSFKKRTYGFIEPGTYRFLYTVVSVITVLPILYLWFLGRDNSQLLYKIGFPFSLISIGMIIVGAALVLNSLIVTEPFEFLGIRGVLKIKSTEKDSGLIISGAYSITRHPLFLGGMLILWSNPAMRLVDFVVAILFSIYFVVGGTLEERKLEEEFGQDYRDYKEKVSMFVPIKWFGKIIRF
jgi:protein-S-isoprenylcysteine O-methyltransferase Ste14